ncbi:MAG: LysR family transcriptional regulator [Desulfovibrionaceae bacterium]|nr:LysR family transcriptional regulator [Desulfovibrionaceae bacterium]
MKNILRDLPLFVEVAKNKSFTLAAEALEMPVSTLSRRIAGLENSLGTTLFYRNSRNVELTANGKIFFERCDFIVSDAKDACEAIAHNMNSPSGWVRFSIPGDVYLSFFEQSLLDFAKKWPDIHLDIHFNERWVDLLTEPYDLDLRIGELPDSNLKARRLGAGRPWLVAAPALIEKFFLPRHPHDLADIPGIAHAHRNRLWELTGKQGETVAVNLRSVHSFNSIGAAQTFILEGMGIGILPPGLCRPHIESGRLIHLLPDWQLPSINAYLVMPSGQLPLRVRLLIEHLLASKPR